MPYYLDTKKEVLDSLKVKEKKGLTKIEAEHRLEDFGPNKIGKERKVSLLKIIISQFNDPLVWVLLAATVVSYLIGNITESIIIIAIVAFNAIIGFFQEYKAEKAIQLLRKLRQFKTRVLRDSKEIEVKTEELVPGDIILLTEGDRIPADCRLLEVVEFKVDESSLTGESLPIRKTIFPTKKTKSLGDQTNMVFAGTTTVKGRAKAVVVATGAETELGKIAKEIQSIEEEMTPLQKRLKEIGKWLTVTVLAISFLVFIIGVLRGFSVNEMVLVGVSLAVAAVPEGLPAVVTITLALGLRKMLKRKALIRKLKSVETLGSVTVICSDKTGTLTKNEMTVTRVYSNNKLYNITGTGYMTEGAILFKGKKSDKELTKLLTACTTCNDATIELGDPTERALKVFAAKVRIEANDRKSEVPFSADTKFMSVTDTDGVTHMKGAMEVVLPKCTYIEINGKRRKLTKKDISTIHKKNEDLSEDALRVLAIAYGKKDLTFLGLVGMIDPPRKEVKNAIKLCNVAGIRTIMITGDHVITAKAVAKQVGIKGTAITGMELDEVSEDDFVKLLDKVNIYARVSSLHKARILKTLQDRGEIVAMTGDGVNDAPALKQSNVGVAMNLKGTEISKDVSDLILMDDNFSTIVSAVEEGRIIYSNIKKFVKYLLSANFGEVLIVLLPILFGLPLPLLAIHILWLNLVTDSFPALALGLEPAEPNVMKNKPRDPKESFFSGMKTFIGISTVIATILVIGLFVYYLNISTLQHAQTVAFTSLVVFELFLVFTCRSPTHSMFKLKPNWYLYGAVLLSFGLQLLLLYSPLGTYFKLVPLSLMDWAAILPLSASGLIVLEIRKMFIKKD